MGPEPKERDLIPQLAKWATLLWVAEGLGALLFSWHVALGVALGGGLSLLFFALYRWLSPALLQSGSRRRALIDVLAGVDHQAARSRAWSCISRSRAASLLRWG